MPEPPIRNRSYVFYHTALDFTLMATYSLIGRKVFKIRTGKALGKEELGVLLVDLFLAKATKTLLILRGIIPENLPEREKESEIIPEINSI